MDSRKRSEFSNSIPPEFQQSFGAPTKKPRLDIAVCSKANQPSTSKQDGNASGRADDEEDLWGEDLPDETVEEIVSIATQVCLDKPKPSSSKTDTFSPTVTHLNMTFKNKVRLQPGSSLLPYSERSKVSRFTFKTPVVVPQCPVRQSQQNGLCSTPAASNANAASQALLDEVQRLRRENSALKSDFYTKVGEVSILRSKLDKAELLINQEKREKIRLVEEKSFKYSQELETMQSLLDRTKTELHFKNLEVKSAQDKCKQLESGVIRTKYDSPALQEAHSSAHPANSKLESGFPNVNSFKSAAVPIKKQCVTAEVQTEKLPDVVFSPVKLDVKAHIFRTHIVPYLLGGNFVSSAPEKFPREQNELVHIGGFWRLVDPRKKKLYMKLITKPVVESTQPPFSISYAGFTSHQHILKSVEPEPECSLSDSEIIGPLSHLVEAMSIESNDVERNCTSLILGCRRILRIEISELEKTDEDIGQFELERKPKQAKDDADDCPYSVEELLLSPSPWCKDEKLADVRRSLALISQMIYLMPCTAEALTAGIRFSKVRVIPPKRIVREGVAGKSSQDEGEIGNKCLEKKGSPFSLQRAKRLHLLSSGSKSMRGEAVCNNPKPGASTDAVPWIESLGNQGKEDDSDSDIEIVEENLVNQSEYAKQAQDKRPGDKVESSEQRKVCEDSSLHLTKNKYCQTKPGDIKKCSVCESIVSNTKLETSEEAEFIWEEMEKLASLISRKSNSHQYMGVVGALACLIKNLRWIVGIPTERRTRVIKIIQDLLLSRPTYKTMLLIFDCLLYFAPDTDVMDALCGKSEDVFSLNDDKDKYIIKRGACPLEVLFASLERNMAGRSWIGNAVVASRLVQWLLKCFSLTNAGTTWRVPFSNRIVDETCMCRLFVAEKLIKLLLADYLQLQACKEMYLWQAKWTQKLQKETLVFAVELLYQMMHKYSEFTSQLEVDGDYLLYIRYLGQIRSSLGLSETNESRLNELLEVEAHQPRPSVSQLMKEEMQEIWEKIFDV